MQTILNSEGYTVKAVENAEEGLALLRRSQFDLVISDLKLPGMSGLDFYRTGLNEGEMPPFVLMTAFGTIEEAVVV